MKNTRLHAFSLIELSIVLVILGLLTGGILAGQSLIRAAELRKITTDIKNFQTAHLAYRSKYLALAGDHNKAYRFFDGSGGRDVCGHGPGDYSAHSHSNCDGDGNGRIDGHFAGENILFWRHLYLAGLIQARLSPSSGSIAYGSPTPIANDVTPHANGGHTPNIPAAPLGGTSGYTIDGRYSKEWLLLGQDSHASDAYHTGWVITPEEAWSIDIKIDDGNAGSGIVRAGKPNSGPAGQNGDCTTTSNVFPHSITNNESYEYKVAEETVSCVMAFDIGL